MKLLVMNGPNLNLLGIREPELYGTGTYADLVKFIQKAAKEAGVSADVFQTNREWELLEAIQKARGEYDGIVINAAAYAHTSIALLDALRAVALPTVEVHLTDVSKREPYRQHSYVAEAALKTIAGRGFEGYREAILFLRDRK